MVNINQFKDALKGKRYSEIPKRRFEDKEDPLIIDPFVSDAAKIINSKSYRRLAGKSQVFPNPGHPHVRTRLSHTGEVVSISEVSSDFLGLNAGLSRAIALGHDIGHLPFGHGGEKTIPIKHERYGVIVVQKIERNDDVGLNLTYPTLEGMLKHSRGSGELVTGEDDPQEYALVMFADKLAYTFADVNDAIRMGRISNRDQLPNCFDFSLNHRALTGLCINALIKESAEKGTISFQDSEEAQQFKEIRDWMYENVYFFIDWDLQTNILGKIQEFYSTDKRFEGTDPIVMVSLMTDNQSYHLADLIRSNQRIEDTDLSKCGLFELRSYVQGKKIDYKNPDLNKEDFIYSNGGH